MLFRSIRDNGRVQVSGEGIAGRVVVLGQQLLKDGSAITITSEVETPSLSSAASGQP